MYCGKETLKGIYDIWIKEIVDTIEAITVRWEASTIAKKQELPAAIVKKM